MSGAIPPARLHGVHKNFTFTFLHWL